MTNVSKVEFDKVKSKSNYYESEYNQLKIDFKKLKMTNEKLKSKVDTQKRLLKDKNFSNSNMKKSLYVIVNALNKLEMNGITNHTLSESLTDVFNASLSGIHNREIESVFDTNDIIDGYTISKGYRETDKECDCAICTSKVTPEEIIEFLEAELFSTEEFQSFLNKVMQDEGTENDK